MYACYFWKESFENWNYWSFIKYYYYSRILHSVLLSLNDEENNQGDGLFCGVCVTWGDANAHMHLYHLPIHSATVSSFCKVSS